MSANGSESTIAVETVACFTKKIIIIILYRLS